MKKLILLGFLAIFAMSGCTLTSSQAKTLGIDEAKAKMLSFVNDNLMQNGAEATISSMSEEHGLYKAVLSLPGSAGPQEVPTYMTKDGTTFFTQALDIAEVEQKTKDQASGAAASQEQTVADIPKADKANVELFVMAFCPYGTQAEAAMSPVFDLLGGQADINVRYIASIEGDDITQVKSLHGPIEGAEDARQLCIVNNYDKDTLWKYIREINDKCYPIYRNGEDAYNTCWKQAAKTAGVDAAKIEKCATDEGPGLIKKADEIATGYGVSGSPTLIVNGTKVNPARTADGYKEAVCNGFTNPPKECDTALSSTGAAASGDCN